MMNNKDVDTSRLTATRRTVQSRGKGIKLPKGDNDDNLEAESLLTPDSKQDAAVVGTHVMAGLTVAGLASSLLTTIFGTFHVDTFLTAYQLPVETYTWGNVIYSIWNTANDVAGAWIVDQVATSRKRTDLVGLTGILFGVAFLAPFFRPWTAPTHWLYDGLHFCLSLSLYDTMYSFSAILYSSIMTDDHEMSHQKRVRFLAICKVVNLVASLAVTRLGLYLFDTTNLQNFRVFLLILVLVACILSVVSQGLIMGHCSLANVWPAKVEKTADQRPTRKLQLRGVVKDFWSHHNFRAWVGMEMLLESQNTFNFFFRKTFVDRLLVANGFDKGTGDWMIAVMKPITAGLSLAAFIPIQKYGYPTVYRCLFWTNLVFSLVLLLVANAQSTNWIAAFLFIYPIITDSISSAGFALAMADMVLHMKHWHATTGRYDEPSLAGMFMGANALLCKPMESFLPIVAAQAMKDDANAQNNLFYILILPPLIYSCLQLLSWSNYDLVPERTTAMRKELRTLLSSQSDDNDEQEGSGVCRGPVVEPC